MIQIEKHKHSANLQLLFLVASIVLFYLLVKPLLSIFLTSIILTYMFYPIYKRIKKSIKYENLSTIITLILIIFIFLMPIVFIASQIPKQSSSIYSYARNNIFDKGLFDAGCDDDSSAKCKLINFISGSGHLEINKLIESILKKTTEITTGILVKIPSFIMFIVLSLFVSFFLLKDGRRFIDNMVKILPLDKKYSHKLIDKFGQITYSVVFAHIIVAITQGALGAIGFYVFGIESAIFWGVVMAIFALIPLIGPAIIWVPGGIFLLVNGLALNSYSEIGKGIGLLIYGILIISTSDNILRIKLVGGKADVHPLVVLVGIIGGLNLFGLIGVFVGPIALSLLITLFKDFGTNTK